LKRDFSRFGARRRQISARYTHDSFSRIHPEPQHSRVKKALANRRWVDSFLAWYFVTIWGSGFLATKIGLMYAAPFTFLTVRFLFGIACMVPIVLVMRPAWPASRTELGHVIVAGLLMHAMHLSGSHYTQYLGVSAGITAVLLTVQPLLTALIASRWMGERLSPRQWIGIGVGFGGVVLVVWHKIDIREMTIGSLCAVIIALLAVTAGTLYQRVFCPRVDLRASTLVQFIASVTVLAPLAWLVEGFKSPGRGRCSPPSYSWSYSLRYSRSARCTR
jgi:drug/metabolite transporter (DMT)-like permease